MEALSPWQLATVLGPVILAVVIIYVLMRRRRLSSSERIERHEAVEDVYTDKDPKDRPPEELR